MERTLYDGKGQPVVYIADNNENSNYLWGGNAVSYILDENIYGWNGQHLGWFVDGVLYDKEGMKVGSTSERCPYATYAEPAKYVKSVKYAKYVRYSAYARPALSSGYGNTDLVDFLESGSS